MKVLILSKEDLKYAHSYIKCPYCGKELAILNSIDLGLLHCKKGTWHSKRIKGKPFLVTEDKPIVRLYENNFCK